MQAFGFHAESSADSKELCRIPALEMGCDPSAVGLAPADQTTTTQQCCSAGEERVHPPTNTPKSGTVKACQLRKILSAADEQRPEGR